MEKIQNWSKGLGAYRTNKNLLELSAKLVVGPPQKPYMLLGDNSKVGIELQDYSNGTGNKNVIVRCNISTGTADFLYEKSKTCPETFSHSETRIWGNANREGRWSASKLQINRYHVDKNGTIRNYPWIITVSNGTGIRVNNANGSAYCQKDSYKATSTVTVNMSDADFFNHFTRWHDTKTAFIAATSAKRIQDAILYESMLIQERENTSEPEEIPSSAKDTTQEEKTLPSNHTADIMQIKPEEIRFKNISTLKPMPNAMDFCMESTTADGKTVYLIFKKQMIEACSPSLWNNFKLQTDCDNIQFTLSGCFQNGKDGKLRFYPQNLVA